MTGTEKFSEKGSGVQLHGGRRKGKSQSQSQSHRKGERKMCVCGLMVCNSGVCGRC